MDPLIGPRPLRAAPAPRRERPPRAGVRHAVAASLLGLALGGCQGLPEAKLWNLEQVHYPDGRPSYTGNVQRDTQYRLRKIGTFLASTGGPDLGTTEEKPIEDPLGVCLENVVELQHIDVNNRRVRGLKIQTFAWLGVDCTYALTRERCMRALIRLGRHYEVEGPIRLAPDVDAVDAAEMRELLKEIVPPARELMAGAAADPGLTADRLRAGCRAVELERLDRDGARRLLAVLNVLLGQGSFDTPGLGPAAELHAALAQRCIGLALAGGLDDDAPLVRAAALEACVWITDNRVPELLRAGISDRDAIVVTRALKLIARFGLPAMETESQGFGGTVEQYEGAWLDLLVQVLQAVFDGEIAVAGCQAMARVTGEPANLRPEAWVEWWNAERARLVQP